MRFNLSRCADLHCTRDKSLIGRHIAPILRNLHPIMYISNLMAHMDDLNIINRQLVQPRIPRRMTG